MLHQGRSYFVSSAFLVVGAHLQAGRGCLFQDAIPSQEMIIGTEGAPQDYPTLDASGAGFVSDPNLLLVNYAGGKGVSAHFGYAVITVNDDGSLTGTMKFLNDPARATSAVSDFDTFTITAR